MRNLKYLKYFLIENSDNEYKNLKKEILDIAQYFKGSFRNYHFLSTGESQFKEFLEEFKEDNVDVDYFMSKYIKTAINDDDFNCHGALMDMLLYKYDKLFPLSGSLLSDDLDDWDEDGAIIKYNYNYHTLELGKKYLYQSYDDLSEFYRDCAKQFPNYFFQYYTKYELKKDYDILPYYSDIIIHKNYSVCIIDLKLLCDENYIKCSYSDLFNYIDYEPNRVKYDIINGCFIEYFGENIRKIDETEVSNAIDRMKMKESAEKYNL